MLPPNAMLIGGIALGLLLALVGAEFFDPAEERSERRTVMPIPDPILNAVTALQTSFDVATAKAKDAQDKENAAQAARQAADDAKVASKTASDDMQVRREALIAVVQSVYQPPLPPAPLAPPN